MPPGFFYLTVPLEEYIFSGASSVEGLLTTQILTPSLLSKTPSISTPLHLSPPLIPHCRHGERMVAMVVAVGGGRCSKSPQRMILSGVQTLKNSIRFLQVIMPRSSASHVPAIWK